MSAGPVAPGRCSAVTVFYFVTLMAGGWVWGPLGFYLVEGGMQDPSLHELCERGTGQEKGERSDEIVRRV